MKIVKLWLVIYIITSLILFIVFKIANKYDNNLLYELLKGNIFGAFFWTIIVKAILK